MTRRSISVLLILGLLSALNPALAAQESAGRTSAKEVKQDVVDAAESIKNYSADKRDEAVQKAKAGLDALDARIDALEAHVRANWDKMDKAARERASASLKALHKQRIAAAEWYGSLKHSSAAAWDQMKQGFSTAYEATREAWQKAEHEFGAKDKSK
jgi:hypothetical protein